jgi:hypothetical protein
MTPTELIIGFMLPGRPIAMMMFKTWGYIVSSAAGADEYVSDDLKRPCPRRSSSRPT